MMRLACLLGLLGGVSGQCVAPESTANYVVTENSLALTVRHNRTDQTE